MEVWSLKGTLNGMTVAKKSQTVMLLQIPTDYGTCMEEETSEHRPSMINFD